jgi:hypothetical protein
MALNKSAARFVIRTRRRSFDRHSYSRRCETCWLFLRWCIPRLHRFESSPLAIAVIGALCISVLLSLIATPTVYLVLRREPPADQVPVEPAVELAET